MNRLSLLGLAAAALVAVPAQAQDTPAMPADSLAADSMMANPVAAVVLDPARARPLYDEGVALAREDDHDGAILKFEEAALNDPSFAPAAYGLGSSLAQLRRYEDARNAFEAAIAKAQAANDSRVQTAAQRGLTQVQEVLAQVQATQSAQASAQASASAMTESITEATAKLNADPVTPENAQQAYDALERARAAGYDANLVAFYYAKALLALDRGAEAVPYAQTALDGADATTDRSGNYIQLGLAQRAAGDTAAARASFEAAREGSWSGWADHYLREMDEASDS